MANANKLLEFLSVLWFGPNQRRKPFLGFFLLFWPTFFFFFNNNKSLSDIFL